MKKSALGVAILSMVGATTILSTGVYAADDIIDYSNLKSCMEATIATTCNVGQDIEIEDNITVTNQITLNLNGYTISVKNPGFAGSNGRGMITVEHGGDLTVSGEGTITTEGSGVGSAIRMTGNTDNTKKAKLTLDSGTLIGDYYAITGNGSAGRDNTEIIINNGTVKGTHTDDNLGIFHPQSGTLTINGGLITGNTGIEMRAGTLVVNGGIIESVATQAYIDTIGEGIVANGSGNTSSGYALAIAQHTTKLPISVTVNAGTLKGIRSFVESNPENNSSEYIAKVSLLINGGTFTGTVASADFEHFVTAGTFNTGLAKNLIAEGFHIKDGVVQKNSTEEQNSTIKSPDTGVSTSENSANSNNILVAVLTSLTVIVSGIALIVKRELK